MSASAGVRTIVKYSSEPGGRNFGTKRGKCYCYWFAIHPTNADSPNMCLMPSAFRGDAQHKHPESPVSSYIGLNLPDKDLRTIAMYF